MEHRLANELQLPAVGDVYPRSHQVEVFRQERVDGPAVVLQVVLHRAVQKAALQVVMMIMEMRWMDLLQRFLQMLKLLMTRFLQMEEHQRKQLKQLTNLWRMQGKRQVLIQVKCLNFLRQIMSQEMLALGKY